MAIPFTLITLYYSVYCYYTPYDNELLKNIILCLILSHLSQLSLQKGLTLESYTFDSLSALVYTI